MHTTNFEVLHDLLDCAQDSSPLHVASFRGDLSAVKSLIKMGLSVHDTANEVFLNARTDVLGPLRTAWHTGPLAIL